jgi:hypothetical protein
MYFGSLAQTEPREKRRCMLHKAARPGRLKSEEIDEVRRGQGPCRSEEAWLDSQDLLKSDFDLVKATLSNA